MEWALNSQNIEKQSRKTHPYFQNLVKKLHKSKQCDASIQTNILTNEIELGIEK